LASGKSWPGPYRPPASGLNYRLFRTDTIYASVFAFHPVSQKDPANLFDLVWLRRFPIALEIGKFIDQFFHKYVMAAADPFLKSQMEQEIAEIICKISLAVSCPKHSP